MENNFNELEQMKEQIALLNKKLEREMIINEKMIRKAVRSKIKSINNVAWIDFILGIIAVLFIALIAITGGVSWAFFAFTCVMLAVDVFFSFKTNNVKSNELIHGNLIEVGQKVARMKVQKRKVLLFFSFPCLLVWVLSFIYEVAYKYSPHPEFWKYSAFCLLIGAVVGLVIGLCIYRKMQRKASDILMQIQDWTGLEDFEEQ